MSINDVLICFPLATIETPKDGSIVYLERFWLTKNGKAFKSRFGGCMQCNKDKSVLEVVYKNLLNDGYEISYLPVAYIPNEP